VREAMGFSQERGDTVNVVNAAFTETKVEPVDIPLWKDPSNVAFAKETLKNLLVIGLAFYLVFGVLRPLLKDWMKATAKKPAVETAGEEMDLLAAFDAKLAQRELTGYDAHISSVREFAKQNPKAAADIIREWMAKE
jgi:flagellar M-ring protein FliF